MPWDNRLQHCDCLGDDEFGPTAGHENAGVHPNPQTTEFRPTQEVFQGEPGSPAHHQCLELVGGGRPCHQQFRFVLGENTARCAQPAGDFSKHDG